MVGAEDVDRAVEAPLELVHEVGDVRRAIGGRAVVRAQEDAVLLVAVGRRARPERTVLLVRVEPRQQLGQPLLELALAAPAVEVDAEALERGLDLLQHQRHRIALRRRDRRCRRLVAVLGRLLPAPGGLDRRPEPLHLAARVVVVVLALHRVAGEVEQARDGVAVGAVAGGGDRDRPGGIRGDHLHLHALRLLGAARAVRVPGGQDLAERRGEPLVAEEEVDEARPGDLGALDRLEPALRPRRSRPRSPAAAAAAPPRAAARRSSRSRRARPRRALELELGPRHVGERGRERPDGISRQRSRRREEVFERPDLVRRADADQDVADLDRRVGLGRRVEAAVRLAQGDHDRSGLVADAELADRPSRRRARPAHLDLGELEVGAGSRRHGVEERGHLWLEHEVRHHLARGRVRKHDAVRAGEDQLPLGVRIGRSRHDRQIGARRAGGEDDVEVVGVRVGGSHEPTRALQARPRGSRPASRLPRRAARRRLARAATAPRGSRARGTATPAARNSSATRRPTRP